MQVIANAVTTGTVASISGTSVTSGKLLDLTNSDLTYGVLLHVATSSANAHSPVLIAANSMTGGSAVKVHTAGITTGSGLEVTTGAGSAMKNAQSPIFSSSISASGAFTVSTLSDASKFAIGDHVILSSCTAGGNNGEYIISGINSAIISLVNIDGSTVSGLDATDNTCKMGHAGGRLVNLVANSQADGTILDINIQGLATGTAFEVTGNTALTSGHLLHLETTSNQATKPVLITADAVTSGTIVHVDAAGLTTGNALLLEGGTSTTMTSGALLKLQTSSTAPLYGVMQVIANSVTSGNVMQVQSNTLTTGTGLLLSSTSSALKNAQTAISSSSISSSGVFTVGVNGEESLFAARDYVTMSGCSTNSNNGDYLVSSTSTNIVNLMNTDGTSVSGLTNTDTDCTLSHAGGRVLNVVADSATGGNIVDVSSAGLQSGSALKVSTNALTTGKAIEIDGGAGLTTGALLSITSSV
eukprot:Stramenopile-MAST_4_protein_5585